MPAALHPAVPLATSPIASPTLPPTRRVSRRAALAGAAALVLGTGVAAQAASSQPTLGQKAVTVAAQQQGKPYRYGAAGPSSFDCSGLTQFVYRQLGKSLPRTADQQYRAISARPPQRDKKPGDLLFFTSRGSITHVTIYAGGDQMWAAPHSGTVVQRERIYSSSYLVARVAG